MMTVATHSKPSGKRESLGLGFLPQEARHGFLVQIPPGNSKEDSILIAEYWGNELSGIAERPIDGVNPSASHLRVIIDRHRWLAIASAFWEEANQRLRNSGLKTMRFVKAPKKPIPVHPSLGKELCILCWAIEEADPAEIPNAILNWQALAPEERWWLYTMAVANTGQAMQRGRGWRKALRAALADNPFTKGEGLAPKSRRKLLGQSQLNLDL